jgi:hypothetical protein
MNNQVSDTGSGESLVQFSLLPPLEHQKINTFRGLKLEAEHYMID